MKGSILVAVVGCVLTVSVAAQAGVPAARTERGGMA